LTVELSADKRLERSVGYTTDAEMAPLNIMLLAKDLDELCKSLANAERCTLGLPLAVTVHFIVAPALDHDAERPRYQVSLQDYFTETIQERLLQPFRRHLPGFKKSKVSGNVAPKLITALRDDIAADECISPAELLNEVKGIKQRDEDLFQDEKYAEAYEVWHLATFTVDRLHYSTSWPILIERAVKPSLTRSRTSGLSSTLTQRMSPSKPGEILWLVRPMIVSVTGPALYKSR
jgi:hypothetical protein